MYLPDYRPRDFVGRTTYLTHLQETLHNKAGYVSPLWRAGIGEIHPNAALCLGGAKGLRRCHFPDLRAASLDTVTAEMVSDWPLMGRWPPEEQREAAKASLRQRQSLLVLDDVMSVQMRQLEPGPNCSVLYTSRAQFASRDCINAKRQSGEVHRIRSGGPVPYLSRYSFRPEGSHPAARCIA